MARFTAAATPGATTPEKQPLSRTVTSKQQEDAHQDWLRGEIRKLDNYLWRDEKVRVGYREAELSASGWARR
jgi:hypothetical protein